MFYGVPILAILLVLRPSQLSNVSGFVTAIQTVFVVYGGHTAAGGAGINPQPLDCGNAAAPRRRPPRPPG